MKNAPAITRRKLAAALVSSTALSTALAQTPAPADSLQTARDRIRAAGDALAKEQIPMAAEPAFQFKA